MRAVVRDIYTELIIPDDSTVILPNLIGHSLRPDSLPKNITTLYVHDISQDLSEPALCFVQTQETGTSLWQVYRGSQQDFALRNQASEPIKRSRNFIELLFISLAQNFIKQLIQGLK